MKLFYRQTGEGIPVIVLHGVFGSSDNWLTPAKVLGQDFKLYLLDQRNHGQSPKSDEFNNKIMAEDLRSFMEEHDLEKAHIIGHSMGGKVAMEFAARYPEKVWKLIVVDIAPKYYPPHHQKILAGLHAIDLKNLKSRQEADQILSVHEPELGVRQFLLKNLYRNSQNQFDWRINLPVISEKIHNVGEAIDENVRINIPVLFIKGEKSNYIKEKDEELMGKIFKNYKVVSIPGAGHWVQAEKPEEFIRVTREFLLS